MLYEKKKTDWKRIAAIVALAFSLAAAWIAARPFLARRSSESGNMPPSGASRENEGTTGTEAARSEMDRLKSMGVSSSPGTDEVRRQMDALRESSSSRGSN
jgi:hypothetical protein